MLLNELIERLQEVQESHDGLDVEVLGIHQMNYPLREEIGAIWDPTADAEFLDFSKFTCVGCGELIQPIDTETVRAYWVDSEPFGGKETSCYGACSECSLNGDQVTKDGRHIVYVRLDGAPYDLNPYGSKEAWSS